MFNLYGSIDTFIISIVVIHRFVLTFVLLSLLMDQTVVVEILYLKNIQFLMTVIFAQHLRIKNFS